MAARIGTESCRRKYLPRYRPDRVGVGNLESGHFRSTPSYRLNFDSRFLGIDPLIILQPTPERLFARPIVGGWAAFIIGSLTG